MAIDSFIWLPRVTSCCLYVSLSLFFANIDDDHLTVMVVDLCHSLIIAFVNICLRLTAHTTLSIDDEKI